MVFPVVGWLALRFAGVRFGPGRRLDLPKSKKPLSKSADGSAPAVLPFEPLTPSELLDVYCSILLSDDGTPDGAEPRKEARANVWLEPEASGRLKVMVGDEAVGWTTTAEAQARSLLHLAEQSVVADGHLLIRRRPGRYFDYECDQLVVHLPVT